MQLLAVIFLASAAAFGSGAGVNSLKRTVDPVVVLGNQVPALCGHKIAQLGLFTLENEYLVPIPFQIDERRQGEYVYTSGSIASTDVDQGALDEDDEIAFICHDAGPRLSVVALPEEAVAGVELELVDPADGGKAYVYLLAFDGAAPRSDEDYVKYHVAENEIESTEYTVGYLSDAPISIGTQLIKPEAGGSGVNVADRQKIRIEGHTLWNLIHLDRSENDFRSQILGYIDGPVRVIRNTKNWQVIFWEIPTPSVELTSVYWQTSMLFPITLKLPFDITKIFRDVRMRIYIDTPPDVPGRRFYNDRNPQGVLIDGQMSQAEQQLDHRPFHWQVVAGSTPQHPEGWFSRHIYDQEAIPVNLPLYYLDDANQADPPERYPGCFGCLGYEFEDLEQLGAGSFDLTVQMFPLSSYQPGDEKKYLRVQDQPLIIKTHRIP